MSARPSPLEQFANDFFVALLAQERKRRFAKPKPPPSDRGRAEFEGLVRWLSKRYGDRIGPFLARRLATQLARANDPCTDNLRVCDLGNPGEVETYERARAEGCCGFCDFEIEHYATGRRFRLGFNYGH